MGKTRIWRTYPFHMLFLGRRVGCTLSRIKETLQDLRLLIVHGWFAVGRAVLRSFEWLGSDSVFPGDRREHVC